MSAKIIVGFTTQIKDGLPAIDPTKLEPPANYSKADTITAWQYKKATELMQARGLTPYLCTFKEVSITLIGHEPTAETTGWAYRPMQSNRVAAPVAIGAWLLDKFPGTWDNTSLIAARMNPQLCPLPVFIGFDVKLFLAILGIECSLPVNQPRNKDGSRDVGKSNALPLSLWNTGDCRDIESIVLPGNFCKGVDWPTMLQMRGIDKDFDDWQGPHCDAQLDGVMTIELAGQLGILSEK